MPNNMQGIKNWAKFLENDFLKAVGNKTFVDKSYFPNLIFRYKVIIIR